MHILCLCGSISYRSSNLALLEMLRDLASSGTEIEIFAPLSVLPFFDPDLDEDREQLPRQVRDLRSKVAQASALVIATPEYAHGLPGVLKNALDWMVSDPEVLGKPVAVIFGSAGDAQFARDSLVESLRTMSARVITEAVLSVPAARGKVADRSNVAPEVTARLRGVVEAIISTVSRPGLLGSRS